MIRILIICRKKTLFTTIQSSVQSIIFYHAATVYEGERIVLSAIPDLVCLALSSGEAKPENIKNFPKVPFLFLLENEFKNQAGIIPGKNSFIICENQFNAEKFISSVFALIYKKRLAIPLYKITGTSPKILPETTGESIYDPEGYAESFLIGTSSAIQFVRRTLCKFAPFPDEVLIFGESGTGKELAARILHHLSGREGPFITINCAALTQNLAESELFGYEKGAFTDAKQNHRGIFEQAHKGTLFLDEVGEMQELLQPKLLRILENDTVVRLGSSIQRKIDVRILSATNADIDFNSTDSRIRRDLLFRLNSLSIYIPPLRERREDIGSLSSWFLSRQKFPAVLSKRSLQLLTDYDWPGNVRQLFGLLRKGIIYSGSDLLSRETIIEITPSMFNPKDEYNFHSVQYSRG